MNTSTGKSSATAVTPSSRSIPLVLVPTRQLGQAPGERVAIDVT